MQQGEFSTNRPEFGFQTDSSSTRCRRVKPAASAARRMNNEADLQGGAFQMQICIVGTGCVGLVLGMTLPMRSTGPYASVSDGKRLGWLKVGF